MKAVGFFEQMRQSSTILCLGAHSDDIEIGCGGTLQRLLQSPADVAVHWVVLSATGKRAEEATESAAEVLAAVRSKQIVIKQFRNGFFPYVGAEIKEFFEHLKTVCKPDLVFSHWRGDLHQDHRVTSELTWNTFRDQLILEYEIPKYDGDIGTPNAFVALTEEQLIKKIDVLERYFKTQQNKQWFSKDTFRALCRLRGIECSSPTGLAEAFYARKLVLA